ncbi:MAG TPA: hypothetical protein PKU69_05010, partial [Bacillota bacterium]|nr:hypothetical protein [Bacillota bacterium]
MTSILGNVSKLLDSAILHATISNQLFEMSDTIVVPAKESDGFTDIKITVGTGEEEFTYISKSALEDAFNALDQLGIDDITNVTVDTSILTNLSTEEDTTELDQDKADILFASTIINATLSKYIIDLTTAEEAIIVIPYEDADGATVRVVDPIDATEYISQVELTNILKALLKLNITDFNSVDSMSLGTITDNKVIMLDSAILHATVSKTILDMSPDTIMVPYVDENGDEIRTTTGPGEGQYTSFIIKDELYAMFDALDLLLGPEGDISTFSGTIDFGEILSVPGNVDTLLESAVIQATISDQVLTLVDADSGDSLLSIPYTASDGSTQIRVTKGDPGFTTEYIIKTEIKAIFDSLNALDITDITTFSGTIDLSLLADHDTVVTVLGSAVIHATIS